MSEDTRRQSVARMAQIIAQCLPGIANPVEAATLIAERLSRAGCGHALSLSDADTHDALAIVHLDKHRESLGRAFGGDATA